MSCHNKAEQTKRTLHTYTQQTYKDFEIVVTDDNSKVNLKSTFKEYEDRLDIKYKRVEHNNSPRGPNIGWLDAYNRSEGEVIVLTHQEIMIPPNAIEHTAEYFHGNKNWRLSFPGFFIHKPIYEDLDKIDWKTDLDKIKEHPYFFQRGGSIHRPNYSHLAQQMNGGIACFFMAWNRERWEWFGKIRKTDKFGADDMDIYHRELFLRRLNVTYAKAMRPHSPQIWAYHQYHRTLDQAPKFLSEVKYATEEQARLQTVGDYVPYVQPAPQAAAKTNRAPWVRPPGRQTSRHMNYSKSRQDKRRDH